MCYWFKDRKHVPRNSLIGLYIYTVEDGCTVIALLTAAPAPCCIRLLSGPLFISQVPIDPGLFDTSNVAKKNCDMFNGNGSYRRNVLNIENICICSTGVDVCFAKLSLLQQVMMETVFFRINDD